MTKMSSSLQMKNEYSIQYSGEETVLKDWYSRMQEKCVPGGESSTTARIFVTIYIQRDSYWEFLYRLLTAQSFVTTSNFKSQQVFEKNIWYIVIRRDIYNRLWHHGEISQVTLVRLEWNSRHFSADTLANLSIRFQRSWENVSHG